MAYKRKGFLKDISFKNALYLPSNTVNKITHHKNGGWQNINITTKT